MKIKNQFIISIIIFVGVLLVISASIFVTNQQVLQLSAQEQLSRNIQTGAADLSYLSNDYFLFRDDALLESWQVKYASIWDDVSKINSIDPHQQMMVENIKSDLQGVNSAFNTGLTLLNSLPDNESTLTSSTFQLAWSRLGVQNQVLAFEVSLLSQSLSAQIDQLQTTNITLIVILLGLFGAYFIINYLVTYRETLKSISKLQDGLAIIGSGNLDYSLKSDKRDEIGEISKSVDQMATNLKNVTTSKLELEKAQESLAKSEHRWATTLSSIGDAVIATDLQGKITFMNNIAEALTGYSLQEATQKQLPKVFHIINEETRQEVENPVTKVLESGCIVGLANHSILVRRDGSEVPIDDSGSPIRDQNGKVTGVVLVFHDITERKQAEQELDSYHKNLEKIIEERTKQLKDAERLAAIGATAGMVGHDIRNPLQAIVSDLYIARQDTEEISESEAKNSILETIDAIEENVFYINKIVADLQDYSRPLNPRTQETNIKSVIEKVFASNGVPEKVKIQVKIDADTELIMADEDFLRRIVGNLVLNAVQAMPDGGKLTVHAFRDKQTNDTILTVKDTGVGIPDEVKPKLFTPMMTTKSKGQGFGLAVVKRMTEGLGGTISFKSQTGKGTTFTMRFPSLQRAKR